MIVPESSVVPLSAVPPGHLVRVRFRQGWVVAAVAIFNEQPEVQYLVILSTDTGGRVPGWVDTKWLNQPMVSYGTSFQLVVNQEPGAYKFGIDRETRGALLQTSNTALLHVGAATDYEGHWTRFYDFKTGELIKDVDSNSYVGILKWSVRLPGRTDLGRPENILAEFPLPKSSA